ncbi:oligoendopeptidase [Halobacillus andaensis]|uniref:Oligoendopeptidase n=1 Tax=Halobacillus andaensis TaxID=1176239 RepID=A0A917EYX2_HALAA|nr:M3 family oligoendopeptidase [Halobacillus andaensis]MBP2005980.1 pepF/M3 family oligoendopeptidase [Halobacillus andaensis]GGF24552.1 oligoendopeptidase [Halobacillus andaensis]
MDRYEPTWDLDTIFQGGSESEELKNYVSTIENKLSELHNLVERFTPPKIDEQTSELMELIERIQDVSMRVRQFSAYISCLSAQDVNDQAAHRWVTTRSELGAKFKNIQIQFDQKLVQIDTNIWKTIIKDLDFSEVAFVLDERREKAKDKLSLEQESIINNLAVDGYHGWSQMYDTIVGKMKIKYDGEELSVGQASNKLSDADRSVRKEVFQKWQQAWENEAELFSQTLNHLAGFRLQTYQHRGWDNPLKEPLEYNRMSEKTLKAMWAVIIKHKKHYKRFLEVKAQWLGVEKLSIYDVHAPIGDSAQKMDYNAGAQFIIEHFRKFSPLMAKFTEQAFENRWIEAEDRPGKRPGGFCTSFPHSKETRIFMTYSGTLSNVATLAHELGHAYHQHVMNDLPGLNQGYAMNVAETASTFAEMIVADAAVKNAKDSKEKLTLLEDKIQRSVAFFMNIHARYLFEVRFYNERKSGTVPKERLNALMVEAQEEAYQEALSEYDQTFWASKLHFHITGVPFYNFPYTFGYLFSLGIYAQAVKEGPVFEEKYIALLQDTGSMRVEDLALKHLNVNLEEEDFWEQALQICIEDVEEFMKLSDLLHSKE